RGRVSVGKRLQVRAEGDGHGVERRTQVGRRRGNPDHPSVAHACQPRAFTRLLVRLPPNAPNRQVFFESMSARRDERYARRQCARSGCSAPATATFTFDSGTRTVWLDVPSLGAARAGELCDRHAGALTPPRGWHLDDRRAAVVAERTE